MSQNPQKSARDPSRLMRLLWREDDTSRPRKGRKPATTLDALIEAAIAIADTEGLEALTIRRLAAVLSVPPMSVYTYVSGKAELEPLMLDAIYLRMTRTSPNSGAWQDRVRALIADNRSLFVKHPWAADVSLGRPALGPGAMAKYEYELGMLEGLGLSDVMCDLALTHMLLVVAALNRAETTQKLAEQRSDLTDAEWWHANAPYFEKAFDAAIYPTAARVGHAAGEALGGAFNAEVTWAFATDRFLAGLAALMEAPAPDHAMEATSCRDAAR